MEAPFGNLAVFKQKKQTCVWKKLSENAQLSACIVSPEGKYSSVICLFVRLDQLNTSTRFLHLSEVKPKRSPSSTDV